MKNKEREATAKKQVMKIIDKSKLSYAKYSNLGLAPVEYMIELEDVAKKIISLFYEKKL